ncbi:Metallo-dependent phosphatase-like protein [Infundibulicybe gibba]|nr:Metallo-dependent phosphatase-like protein [Infundibulicybe gibba]
MAYTLYRILRAFRSICIPLTAVIGFSCMLTFIFILYQPTPGPGIIQRLGWQSWAVIQLQGSIDAPTSGTTTALPSAHTDVPAGVDWWNVTTPVNTVDSSSLPLDKWAPLMPHNAGLSEIAVTRCLINPEISGDLCAPDSTSEDDAIKGKWVRVPRNLNLEANYLSGWLNIYYRRTRRQDINLITDIRLLQAGESPLPIDNWHHAALSLRSGVMRAPPLYLWYRTGKTLVEMNSEERSNLITELDILYGEDVPWYGFEKLEPPTMPEKGRVEATWLTYRRGVKSPPKAPPLHFSSSGNFKILQVADLHFSVSQGICRDTDLEPCVHSDNLTTNLISRVIDAEKPDFVVFTGDQLNGQGTSWDPKSVLAKFARAVTDKGIPWSAVFGNHDEESGIWKEEQVQLMKALPYSLVERGPKGVHGVGNYVLKVKSPDASKTHLLTLYFLDSGSYSKGFFDWWGFFTPTAYDWIHKNQIDWFLQQSASINPIERPFTPDSGKDLGNIWKRQSPEQITPTIKRLAKPNALMFFHIPLPEAYAKADADPRTNKALDVGASGQEQPGNAKHNDGFFENGILKAMESDHTGKGHALEVKVVGNGHCHVTENCRRVKGVWMCFGGGGSYSGYGKIGFDRRFRVYDISDFGETIRTYKRTEKNEVIDEMVISGKGAAPS